jgi:hypothetical protein
MTVENRIGCRNVFGVLVPDFNSVVEPELADMRIAGVSNQTTRFPLDAGVLEHLASAAERLLPSGVQSWIIGLATDSFANGLNLLDQGIEILRERTGLPTLHLIEALEKRYDRPVVTSNQASYWQALRAAPLSFWPVFQVLRYWRDDPAQVVLSHEGSAFADWVRPAGELRGRTHPSLHDVVEA